MGAPCSPYRSGSVGGETKLENCNRMALRNQTCYTDEEFYDDGFGSASGQHQRISLSGGESDVECRQRVKGPLGGCFCAGMRTMLCGGQGKSSFLHPKNSFLTCQDAMLVALKSLMPACLFNVIGFGSTFKTLFPSSQTYNEVRRGHGWDQKGSGGEKQRQGRKRKEEVTPRPALIEPVHPYRT